MIPILYDKDETEFTSNGRGRLRDVIEATVVEERNGLYELDFSYPVTGAHYDEIQIGRIVGVTHDESGDIQPFDIVSYTKPIDGVVSFHCVHISYRLCYIATELYTSMAIGSLADALYYIKLMSMPSDNPFEFWTDKDSTGYLGCTYGIPHSIRSMLGGVEGSILDSYGGEYEWDKFTVKLWGSRGQKRDFAIRYGVNMLGYDEEYDIQGTYSSCVPYWTDGVLHKSAPMVRSNGSTITGRGECVPLDLSDKFEEMPGEYELQDVALAYMDANNTFLPKQTIQVEFIRLQDMGEEYSAYENLLECNLCDTITVIYPDYNGSAEYKIVKTVWDVLRDRYESMELGELSVTLAEALGVSSEKEAKNNILNSIYPVGSIYISTNIVSPADLFGGTWVQIKGRFLLGTGEPSDNTNTYWGTDLTFDGTHKLNEAVKSKGGESIHTLIESEMPTHTHDSASAAYDVKFITASAGENYAVWGGQDTPYQTGSAGGSGSHNNMPPFYAVYMWERTA